MKTSLITVALVTVATSLATVGIIELLRGARPGSQPDLAVEPPPGSSAALAPRGVEPVVSATHALDQPPGYTAYEDRLLELERRLAALELGSTSRRAPVPSATAATGELPPQDDLRDLVLDWVAEEREARWRAEELQEAEDRRKEQEFDARFHAYMLAQEHDLADWQKDKLAQVFLEVEVRRVEIEEDIDPLTDDPEEVEERWVEFDEWAEQVEKEELGELYDQISGDD